ncbi:hypothetical protein F0P96_14145 [Hymenobacter busanensis]|uniref:Uncharacterized protein n=1 Tax=Hymenobacter busanensis TaxID=2607656 RepID=A0A7L5A0D3_9BACT|nr:hypothetical protein [Hymenobacter busanensis]KAA9331383.1 hypothetical protein F0P96_14145 [Hymenobacter busanensis]QHJ08536.1 hypothetical protein GUY19_15070 [Hymenobacter busanensis]
MSPFFTFLEQSPLFFATGLVCGLLGILLVAQALRRPDGRRRIVRVLVSVLLPVALWLSVFPPSVPTSEQETQAAILVTDGTPADSLRFWQRRLGAAVPVLRYTPGHVSADSTRLTGLYALRTQHPQIRQLHVLGHGLPAADVGLAPPEIKLIAHPQWPARGFRHASWAPTLPLGDVLRVEGRFVSANANPTLLYLRSAGVVQDSLRLPAGNASFTLQARLRATGPQVLQLEARQNRQLIAHEPVPTVVEAVRHLRVLLLAGGPSFELNLLKNRLAANGHAVAQRLTLARSLQQTDFLNLPAQSLRPLTPPLLSRYDAVVADESVWATLGAAETRALSQSVDQGLGMVLLASGSALPKGFPQRAVFGVRARPALATETVEPIRWSTIKAQAAVPATLTGSLLVPLAQSARNEWVAASYRATWGTTVVATPSNTYQWLLAGNTATYDDYWRLLLKAAARPLGTQSSWQFSAWPHPHFLLQLHFSGNGLPSSLARIEGPFGTHTSLGLRQFSSALPVFSAAFWPKQPGWHKAITPGAEPASFYVFAAAEWIGPTVSEQAAAVEQRAYYPTSTTSTPGRTGDKPLAGVWFFTIFLLGAAFLWLEEKF